MKDDLISRKAAVSRISDLLMLELKGQRIPTWNEVYNAIGDIPSVPSVPLDKVCEWLNSTVYPCNMCGKYPCSQCEPKPEGCWKTALLNWMEEQGASNK